MNVSLHLILVVVALVLLVLATFGVGGKFNLVAAALFCWLLAFTFAV